VKKIIIPLLVLAVVLGMVFSGCVPAVAPVAPITPPPAAPAPPGAPVTPPAAPAAPAEVWWGKTAADIPELAGKCRPDLKMDYGEPFAFKPDGTPYRIANDLIVMNCEEIRNYEAVLASKAKKAGFEYSMFDDQFNSDLQIAYYEDLAALPDPPDIIMSVPPNEIACVPAIDKLAARGCQIYCYGISIYSDNVISLVQHWDEGPIGGGVCGKKWGEIMEQRGLEHLDILEIWCARASGFSVARHFGHYNAIKPLIDEGKITLIESIDNAGSEETAAQIVIDNLTANPEIDGIYMQCGGQSGIVSGLRAIGKLLPIEDPGHIIVVTYEGATPVMAEMEKGTIDYVATHGPWDQCDLIMDLILWNTVCGVAVPQNVVPPMFVLDKDLLNNPVFFDSYFGALYWTQMPMGKWDLWPVLDYSKPGCLQLRPEHIEGLYYGSSTPWQVTTPSIADRKANVGY